MSFVETTHLCQDGDEIRNDIAALQRDRDADRDLQFERERAIASVVDVVFKVVLMIAAAVFIFRNIS